MIEITAKEEAALLRYLNGMPINQIADECGIQPMSVRALLRLLEAKGLLNKIGPAKYQSTGAQYCIVKTNAPFARPKVVKEPKVKLDPEVLDYIKGHYPYFRNRRGILAKRLGISRTLLNQIAIDYKLAREA